jgi:hypothetical protein
MLFHHDPLHSDDFLDDLYREARDRWRALGGEPDALEMALERAETELGAGVAAPPSVA